MGLPGRRRNTQAFNQQDGIRASGPFALELAETVLLVSARAWKSTFTQDPSTDTKYFMAVIHLGTCCQISVRQNECKSLICFAAKRIFSSLLI